MLQDLHFLWMHNILEAKQMLLLSFRTQLMSVSVFWPPMENTRITISMFFQPNSTFQDSLKLASIWMLSTLKFNKIISICSHSTMVQSVRHVQIKLKQCIARTIISQQAKGVEDGIDFVLDVRSLLNYVDQIHVLLIFAINLKPFWLARGSVLDQSWELHSLWQLCRYL